MAGDTRLAHSFHIFGVAIQVKLVHCWELMMLSERQYHPHRAGLAQDRAQEPSFRPQPIRGQFILAQYSLENSRFTQILTNGPSSGIRRYLVSTFLGGLAILASASGAVQACPAWNGETGIASYYGPGLQGGRTATGETFDMWAMTAAHPCMPLGTRIRVTVVGTGRTLIVTVNDRMPSRRRVLDLSLGAARLLGITSQGIAMVQLSPA